MTSRFTLALVLATLFGCSSNSSSPTAPAPTPEPAPRIEKGSKLVPGGKVLFDPLYKQGAVWDSTRLELMSVDSFWIDTSSAFRIGNIKDVALTANARSKQYGLDTVYQYTAIEATALTGLVARTANGFRLPTALEARYLIWEGATTRYPWGTDPVVPASWRDKIKMVDGGYMLNKWGTIGASGQAWLDVWSGNTTCPFDVVGINAGVGGLGVSVPHPLTANECQKRVWTAGVLIRSK